MRSGTKTRLAKLEATAKSPSPIDAMTADELRIYIIDKAKSLLACNDISEEHRTWVKQTLIAQAGSNGVVDWDALRRVAMPRDLQRYCDVKRWK